VSIVFTSDVLGNVSVNEITYRDTYWDDLKIDIGGFRTVGGSAPTELVWLTNLRIYEFNAAEELHFETQLPHNYKEGTDLKVHVHWTPHTRGVAENGNTVNWRAEITAQPINGTFTAGTVYDMTATCDGVNHKHLRQAATADLSGSSLTVSSVLVGRVYRLAGDTWATNTATNRPALLSLDFHYEIDSPGTRQELTK
jgi:hypothetical protein